MKNQILKAATILIITGFYLTDAWGYTETTADQKENRSESPSCPYSQDQSNLNPLLGKVWKFSYSIGSKNYADYIHFDYEIDSADSCPIVNCKKSTGDTGTIGWTTDAGSTEMYVMTFVLSKYYMFYNFTIDGIKATGAVQFIDKETGESVGSFKLTGNRYFFAINQYSESDEILFSKNIQDLKFLEGTRWSITSDDSTTSDTPSLTRTIIFGEITTSYTTGTVNIACESDIGAGNFYYIKTNNFYTGGFDGTKISDNYFFDIYDNKLYGLYSEENKLTGEESPLIDIVGELIPDCTILSKSTIQIINNDQIDTAPIKVTKEPVGDSYSLDISFPCYTEPVDIYVAFIQPDGVLKFIQSDGTIDAQLLPIAQNTSDATKLDFVKDFSKGDYMFYWVVLPANGGDILAGDLSGPSILGCYPYTFK